MTATLTPGVDTRDMQLIHRVFRREFGLAPRLVRDAAGDRPRARRVAAHLAEMLDFLHTHHTGEDLLLWPVLRPRVTLDAGLIDRMEAQHGQIAAAITAIRSDLAGWSGSSDPAAGDRIAAAVESMAGGLEIHLTEEEEQVLPLVAQVFTQAEWDELGKHGFAAIPARRRLVILGHILEDADPAERARFLRRVPPAVRLAFRLIGQSQHRRETTVLRGR
jgi:Hemerythrin HHE cation binding domain